MITTAGIYIEGKDDFKLAEQHGNTVPSVDPVTQAKLFKQTFLQLSIPGIVWTPKPWSSPGPSGSYLVEETQPRDIGGGLVQWDRNFAQLPPTRKEFATVTHNYQFIKADSNGGSTPELLEIPYTVIMTTTFSYFENSGDPSTVIPALEHAFKYVKVGNEIWALGTVPDGSAPLLHEDESFSRWRGNIFEKIRREVPYFDYHQG